MEYLNLDLTDFPDDRWEWTPLELTDDVNKQVYGRSGSVYTEAIKDGQRLYAEQTAEYERAMSPTAEDTPERREAVDAFKRLLGRR